MRDKEEEIKHFNNKSTVYGPVKSWRLGMSLGIDPIFTTSTCSFNCVYCQLGNIQNITQDFKTFVPTEKVINDFKAVIETDAKIDAITFSGSGEPTLAVNIDKMISGIRKIEPNIKQYILTNATELYRPEVRQRLTQLDCIIVKIDAADEETFQKINRPAKGVTLEKVISGVESLKNEFQGKIEVQSMFSPLNLGMKEQYLKIIERIQPSTIQLNTPKRPYPSEWHRENRGNHEKLFDYKVTNLKTLSISEAKDLEHFLSVNTGIEVISIYPK